MFPRGRFEPTWTFPQPTPSARRVTAAIPIGHPRAPLEFILWVDASGRLAADWPGFVGTMGAQVEVDWSAHGGPRVTGTRDPVLGALADPVPLTRRFAERLNARCMRAYGLLARADDTDGAGGANDGDDDTIACPRHGAGIRAFACKCVAAEDGEARDVVVLYDVGGDFPDCMCPPCVARFQAGDPDVVVPVCSRCQQHHLYRHRVVARTWYGAAPSAGTAGS
jgi:hypothetical protein